MDKASFAIGMKLGARFSKDPGVDPRVYVIVRRAPSDRYLRRPAPGQVAYWFRRKRYLVTTRRRPGHEAGLFCVALRAGHTGFIQIYGTWRG